MMQENNTHNGNPQEGDASRSRGRFIFWVRLLASVLVALHVCAVFVGPLAVEPTSDLGRSARRLFQPYIEANEVNHGYKFFAPDPGPSHLVRYELTFDDGRETLRGTFPDLAQQQPRLLYHRFFMMTEAMNWMYAAPVVPEAIKSDPEAVAQWKERRRLFQSYVQSWADHLKEKHGAKSVKLSLVRHHLPSPEDVLEGRNLKDPAFFEHIVIYPHDEAAS